MFSITLPPPPKTIQLCPNLTTTWVKFMCEHFGAAKHWGAFDGCKLCSIEGGRQCCFSLGKYNLGTHTQETGQKRAVRLESHSDLIESEPKANAAVSAETIFYFSLTDIWGGLYCFWALALRPEELDLEVTIQVTCTKASLRYTMLWKVLIFPPPADYIKSHKRRCIW